MKDIKVTIEFSKGMNNKQSLSLIIDKFVENVYDLFTNFLQSENVGEEAKHHFKSIFCTDFTYKSFCLCFEFDIFDTAKAIVFSFIDKNKFAIEQFFKEEKIREIMFMGEEVDVAVVVEGVKMNKINLVVNKILEGFDVRKAIAKASLSEVKDVKFSTFLTVSSSDCINTITVYSPSVEDADGTIYDSDYVIDHTSGFNKIGVFPGGDVFITLKDKYEFGLLNGKEFYSFVSSKTLHFWLDTNASGNGELFLEVYDNSVNVNSNKSTGWCKNVHFDVSYL